MADPVIVLPGTDEHEEHHTDALTELSKRVDALVDDIAGKADRDHSHEEMYSSLESQLEGKADKEHEHPDYARHEDVDELIIALDDDLLDAIGEDEHTEVAPGPEPVTEIGEGPEHEEEHSSSEKHAGSLW